MKTFKILLSTILTSMLGFTSLANPQQPIVTTSAYTWQGDTIIQGQFRAWAPTDTSIISTYSAQPGYFMPIDKSWTKKNDLSPYPILHTNNRLHTAIYNMGLDEMINNIEPDTTLRTGKEWAGVWTRDVSYSILLSMAYLQPEAAMISLRHKVNAQGQIIQDTGSGGAWPVSSDRLVWTLAAYEIYKVTGDRQWLKYIYPIIRDSFERDFRVTYTPDNLVKGETSFIDWREQSYPRWMQTADIYNSEAMNTNVVHAAGLNILSKIASELGDKTAAQKYAGQATKLTKAINDYFWMNNEGYYAMYRYGRDNNILNPRAETLGESLAILYDVADSTRAASITSNVPVTPFGPGIFFPQIADMRPYHNNALWPFVASLWALANAKAGNPQGTLQAIGSVFRPAALFATNKENFVLDNGDIATELNSSNMLWSLAGNLGITYRILFGIQFEPDGIRFAPFVPKEMAAERSLTNFKYRGADLSITVQGYGNKIASMTINGKTAKENFLPAKKLKGHQDIIITMANNDIPEMKVNNINNIKAPLTPITRWEHDPILAVTGVPYNNTIVWNPVEYATGYYVLRNGRVVAHTNATSYQATIPGEYMVMSINSDGITSFASEPLSNTWMTTVEMPGETTKAVSDEISYPIPELFSGWHGNGFVETDHKSGPIALKINIPEDGKYAIYTIYANGNGPVNTENKCAVRSLSIDGNDAGTLVMPHRGVSNWSDWGNSNHVVTYLKQGQHTLSISLEDHDENMNLHTNHALIDRIVIQQVGHAY